MKKRPITASLALILLFTGLFCSCVSNQVQTTPWTENNQRIGTITTRKQPWGTSSDYKDRSGRLMRVEKRNFDGRLLAGICTVQFSYDLQGNLMAARSFNSDGHLTLNPDGYAATTFTYSYDPDGDRVVEERYFDENNQPVVTRSGFAILRRTETQNGQIKTIQFFNLAGAPAPSTWLGVTGVVEVQYAYLQGVTPIVCAAFLNAAGDVVERQQMSGQTSESWSSSYTTYNYYDSYHPYYHRPQAAVGIETRTTPTPQAVTR